MYIFNHFVFVNNNLLVFFCFPTRLRQTYLRHIVYTISDICDNCFNMYINIHYLQSTYDNLW